MYANLLYKSSQIKVNHGCAPRKHLIGHIIFVKNAITERELNSNGTSTQIPLLF